MAFPKFIALTALALAFGVSALAQTTPAADQPTLTIVSPTEGQSVSATVNVEFRVANIKIERPMPGHVDQPGAMRTGHIHVRVDDTPWIWLHDVDEPVGVAGLSPGPHKVRLELAGSNHRPVDSKTVTFTVAAPDAGKMGK